MSPSLMGMNSTNSAGFEERMLENLSAVLEPHLIDIREMEVLPEERAPAISAGDLLD